MNQHTSHRPYGRIPRSPSLSSHRIDINVALSSSISGNKHHSTFIHHKAACVHVYTLLWARWILRLVSPVPFWPGRVSRSQHVFDRERYFLRNWAQVTKECENSLKPADIERVRLITSWDVLQKELFDLGTEISKGIRIPCEISLLEPTIGHYHRFTHIFESQLAPGLQANFFWGIVGLLLQLTAQDLQALSKIPRMLKSLGYKVEAFKQHYSASTRENAGRVKEACFDMQVQLVQFFTTAVNIMRGEEDSWSWLQREFINTNQALSETLSRVESLVTAPSPLGQTISSDIASITQQVSLMQLPTEIYPAFFGRESTFEKMDQILGRDGSTTF
ncbi:hypothetical protein ACHAPX_010074 [Trichoderma viride]